MLLCDAIFLSLPDHYHIPSYNPIHPDQFFTRNFYKRRNQPQKFLTFSFNSFAKLALNFKAMPSASPKLLNLDQEHPSKKSQKIETKNLYRPLWKS